MGEAIYTDFKFGRYINSQGPSEQKPIQNYGEKGAWAWLIQRLPKFLGVPLAIAGTDKATNFKFCTHIYRLDRNNSPLQISGKVAVGVVREGLRKIFRAPM